MFDQGFRFAREWMKVRRQQMGLTQADIAVKLGVGQTAVSQWESGRVAPSTRNLFALAAVLECNPTDLVESDGEPVGDRDELDPEPGGFDSNAFDREIRLERAATA